MRLHGIDLRNAWQGMRDVERRVRRDDRQLRDLRSIPELDV